MSCRRVLAFDVETTGLIPKSGSRPSTAGPQPLTEYPHIIQFSFAVYDLYDQVLVRTFDSHVKIGESIEISDFVSNLTGINREDCNNGKDIITILQYFYEAYIGCNVLVAHNMDFDEKMIQIEIERNRAEIIRRAPYLFTMFSSIYESVSGIERYCTMKKGTALCSLEMPSKPNQVQTKQKKWPKLVELYPILFPGEVLENAHNSLFDVLGCLRCYLKMRHKLNHNPSLVGAFF